MRVKGRVVCRTQYVENRGVVTVFEAIVAIIRRQDLAGRRWTAPQRAGRRRPSIAKYQVVYEMR